MLAGLQTWRCHGSTIHSHTPMLACKPSSPWHVWLGIPLDTHSIDTYHIRARSCVQDGGYLQGWSNSPALIASIVASCQDRHGDWFSPGQKANVRHNAEAKALDRLDQAHCEESCWNRFEEDVSLAWISVSMGRKSVSMGWRSNTWEYRSLRNWIWSSIGDMEPLWKHDRHKTVHRSNTQTLVWETPEILKVNLMLTRSPISVFTV